jgi:uncharacterized protein
MRTDRLRVVFDTSVYISAFVFPESVSFRAYLLAVMGKVDLFASPAIIRELTRKLTGPKFGLTNEEAELIVRRIAKTATFVKPRTTLTLLEDEPDNRILECAVESNAHLVVSGDFHLIDLKAHEGIGIVRAADLLHIVSAR